MIPVSWIIGAVGVAVAAIGGAMVGYDIADAKHLRAAEARQSNVEQQRYKRAQRVTVVVSSPVREKVTAHVIEAPVFRDASCDVGPDGVRNVNEAISGRGSAGSRQLPAADGDH